MRKPAIAALHVDDDGRLWVQHTETFGKVVTTYDVFDAKGKHLARVSIPLKVAVQMPVKSRGNLLWLAVQDADDVTYVAHYRIQ
ncbi:MAG: hypothetical protein ACO1Q7_12030 [Gemmatimonas sp.]